jgi:hypothetical protein
VRERFLSPAIPARLPGLLIGLVVFGLGIALMVRAGAGLGPVIQAMLGVFDRRPRRPPPRDPGLESSPGTLGE